jgi:hypothetical protein
MALPVRLTTRRNKVKGQMRTGWNLAAVLVASAGLALAQVSTISSPVENQTYGQQANVPGIGQGRPEPQSPVGPGTINYVEGLASINGQGLSPQAVGRAAARPGDVITTSNGYVEVLLTPGAFLRLGHDSEIRIASAGLADTSIQLTHGSAVLEVDQLIEGTHLAVQMNGASAQVQKRGLYNFDGSKQAIQVIDGKLEVAEAAGHTTLNKNNQVVLASDRPLKRHSFDEQTVKAEPLYVWSQARSQDEAQASFNAAQNAPSYASAGPGWFWDPYDSFYGFWPYDAYLASPFGWGFYSPLYFGFYGGVGGWYGHPGRYGYAGVYGHPGYHGGGAWHGHVNGMNARVGSYHGGGFAGGGFHGGGFAGGGFHGGGGGFHGGGGGGGHR